MNIEKSRLISEAAPHLNASLGTINGNEFAATCYMSPRYCGINIHQHKSSLLRITTTAKEDKTRGE